MHQVSVFRTVSLERLASPEQLDQLLRVTDVRGWVVLVAIGVVLLTALGWGVVGSIPETVSGVGMLIRSGGVFEVVPIASGRVTDLAVNVGDVVSEGQVVARMEQPDLANRLQQAKAQLANLRVEHAQVVANGARDLALQFAALAQQRANVAQSITTAEQSATWYRDKIAIQERLVREGLLIRQTLLNTHGQLDDSEQKISEGNGQLAQIAVHELQLHTQRQDALRASQSRVDEQARLVAQLEDELKTKTEIVAPFTGRILEVMAEEGSIVAAGQPILSLDLTGRTVKDLVAVIYVPSIDGKRIRVGMPILIAPSTVKQEEYGMMLGRVTYVSDFPATSRGMLRVLKNDRLVAGLSGSDAPYEIHADLVLDPATASRYQWSSSKGPPLQIESGTLATARITVAAKRPLELVVPLVRRYTGI